MVGDTTSARGDSACSLGGITKRSLCREASGR
jgi:hypothetical protein